MNQKTLEKVSTEHVWKLTYNHPHKHLIRKIILESQHLTDVRETARVDNTEEQTMEILTTEKEIRGLIRQLVIDLNLQLN